MSELEDAMAAHAAQQNVEREFLDQLERQGRQLCLEFVELMRHKGIPIYTYHERFTEYPRFGKSRFRYKPAGRCWIMTAGYGDSTVPEYTAMTTDARMITLYRIPGGDGTTGYYNHGASDEIPHRLIAANSLAGPARALLDGWRP